MITIKKLTIFEQTILRFKKAYPIRFTIIILAGLLELSVITNCLSMVIYDSSGMGIYSMGDTFGNQICMMIPGLEICLNIEQTLKFGILSILIILLYFKIKDLLIYRNENL